MCGGISKLALNPFTSGFSKNAMELRVCCCLRRSSKSASPQTPRKSGKGSSMFDLNQPSSFIFSTCLVFLLVTMLWSLQVEGAPVEDIRQYYLNPKGLPSCDQPPSPPKSDVEGVCPSRACLDTDLRRRPVNVIRVRCYPTVKSSCSEVKGDFQCTQLYVKTDVWIEKGPSKVVVGQMELWTLDNKTRAMVPTTMDVEQGCICASVRAKPSERRPVSVIS